MRLDLWQPIREDPWAFLKRVASAIRGAEVEVRPGGYPAAVHVHPKDYLSRILLPSSFLQKGKEMLLNGSFSHELLHTLETDPKPLGGIPWGVWLMANALEDARIETQLERRWPGLVQPIKELSQRVLAFRRRTSALASSADTLKLYEVGLALYLKLVQIPQEVIHETASEMAAAVAEELLPIAFPALAAAGTAEVVEIARKICEELAKAAEAVAKRIGTAAATAWVSSVKRELKEAMAHTVEEVMLRISQPYYSGPWFGPWYRGRGGYPFYSAKWEWKKEKADNYHALSRQEIARILQEAAPLIEERITRKRQLIGQLNLSANLLVQAALGRERRVFQKAKRLQKMLLLPMLGTINVLIFIEAHEHYTPSQWLLLKALAATLARLFSLAQTPLLVVRAWNCTRAKGWVENPITHQKYDRWSKDHYINIAQLKGPDAPWNEGAEALLASMPRQGFNNPLEGYPRLKSWELKLSPNNRPTFYIIVGNAGFDESYWLNISSGHHKYATEPLRGKGQRAIYINVGVPISSYDERVRELETVFDGFVQATTLHEAIRELLYTIVIELAEEDS